MAPAVASHSRTGNRAYPNRKATDSPAMIGSLILDGGTGLNGILRSHGCQMVSEGVFIHPQGKGTQSHRNISRLLNVAWAQSAG